MNEVIRILSQRKSERSFSAEPVADEMLDAIIEAGYRAPTTKNGQIVSVVVVRDAAKRSKLAEYSGNQPWVASAPVFLVVICDLTKLEAAGKLSGHPVFIQNCVEGLMIGGVDCGIAVAAMMIAANSFGLGAVPIGGIRNNPQDVVDLLKLPPLTFALVGLCIGHVDKPSLARPRLAINTFRHEEAYNPAPLKTAAAAYDKELLAFWKSHNRSDGNAWSATIGPVYDHNYRPKIRPTLTKQGLSFTD